MSREGGSYSVIRGRIQGRPHIVTCVGSLAACRHVRWQAWQHVF